MPVDPGGQREGLFVISAIGMVGLASFGILIGAEVVDVDEDKIRETCLEALHVADEVARYGSEVVDAVEMEDDGYYELVLPGWTAARADYLESSDECREILYDELD